MDKARGLIRIAPLIYGIDNWVSGYVREVLLSALDRLTNEDDVIKNADADFDGLRHYFSSCPLDEFGNGLPDDKTRDPVKESALDRAWKLLTHPSIQQIEDGGLAEMRAAVITMRESNDAAELTEAAKSLVEACYVFGEHFYVRLPDHLLGEWGGKLFRYMLAGDPKELVVLAQSLGAESPTGVIAPTDDLSIDQNVRVDPSTFTVQMGLRRPCFLGNGRQFKLLAHLIANPFRYVAFADLASIVGGDELDREAVIVTKHRLCKRLIKEGYEDVALMLRAQPDHYAFWPT